MQDSSSVLTHCRPPSMMGRGLNRLHGGIEMKATWLALGAMLLLSMTAEGAAQTQPPEIPFDSVPDFLRLPPDIYFGEVAGIAVNSKGHIFVLSRGNTSGPAYGAAAAQLLEFAADGKFLR